MFEHSYLNMPLQWRNLSGAIWIYYSIRNMLTVHTDMNTNIRATRMLMSQVVLNQQKNWLSMKTMAQIIPGG